MAYLILSALVFATIGFFLYVWRTIAHGRKRVVPHLTISEIVASGDLPIRR